MRKLYLAFGLMLAGLVCLAQAQVPMTGAGKGAPSPSSPCPGVVCLVNSPANVVLSGGNLTATGTDTNYGTPRSNTSHSSGQYYFEVTATAYASTVGLVNGAEVNTDFPGSSTNSLGLFMNFFGGKEVFYNNAVAITYGENVAPGTVLGFAFDLTAQRAYFRISNGLAWWGDDGSSANGDPVAGTHGFDISALSGSPFFVGVGVSGIASESTINFGATSFTYTPPTGYGNW